MPRVLAPQTSTWPSWLSLRRVTSGGGFIPQIDGLRFIAIASVLLFHIHSWLKDNGVIASPIAHSAWMNGAPHRRGVELFFVISGFILGLPFARMHIQQGRFVHLREYFLRRLTRLEPPYIVHLVLRVAALIATGQWAFRAVLPHLLASLVYAHNLAYPHEPNPINTVIWSLEIEVQFYCLVPVISYLFAIRKRRRSALVLIVLATSLLSLPLAHTFLYRSILYMLPFFLSGFVMTDMYLDGALERKSFYWDAVALIGWPAVWLMPGNIEHLLLPPLFILLFASAFRGRISSRVLSLSFVTNIGGMCYSIYLLHNFVISHVGRLIRTLHLGPSFLAYFCLQCAILLPIAVLFCAAFFVAVERPCMNKRWPSKLLDRLRPAVPVTT
jgi:peptidoglycan/LPS O-acetylase OafA/YrhL